MPDVLQETVIRLGTSIDTQGLDKIMSFLSSSRLKTMALTAALSAATTAVYNFVKSAAESERALVELAKKQHRTVEETRAQETALKTMGKTLNEVKKDADLKKTYDQLLKINREMALPEMSRTIANLNGLRSAWWQLKDTAQYVVSWIGARVLANLEAPIKRITERFEKIAKWVRDNLTTISTKIGSYLTAFAKGVIGVMESFGKIIEFVNELDPGIRKLGTAVAMVWAIVQSGPIGQILAAITAIGGLIDDFENFQWNKSQGITGDIAKELYKKENGFFDENGYLNEAGKKFILSQNPDANVSDIVGIAFSDIWGSMFNEKGELDIGAAATKAVETITKSLNDFLTGEGQINIADIFKFDSEGAADGGLIGKVTSWLNENEAGLADLGSAFINAISRGLNTGGGLVSAALGNLFTALTGVELPDSITTGENPLANGIITGITTKLFGGSTVSSIIVGLATAFTKEGGVQAKDFEQLGSAVFTTIKTSIDKYHEFAEPVLSSILGAIFGEADKTVKDENGNEVKNLSNQIAKSALGDAIMDGLAIGLSTGKVGLGIIGGIGSAILAVVSDPTGTEWEKLKEACKNIAGKVMDFLFGEETEVGGKSVRQGGFWDDIVEVISGLWDVISPVLDTIMANLAPWFDSLKSTLQGVFSDIANMLWIAIYNAIAQNGGQDLLDFLGISNPNTSRIETDSEGNSKIVSTEGFEMPLTPEQAMEIAPFVSQLVTNGKNVYERSGVRIEPNGNVIDLSGGSSIEGTGLYTVNGTSLFDKHPNLDPNIARKYYRKINEVGFVPDPETGEGAEMQVGADTTGAVQEIEETVELVKNSNPVLKVNVAFGEARRTIQDFIDALNGGGNTRQAYGGRIGSEMNNVTVGEDGTEYIIPITKPNRAAALLKQMFNEMGSTFTNRIMSDLGLGTGGTIGSDLSSIASMVSSGAVINMNYNISAPCNINVSASGASAQDVGEHAYNAAQRHLLRTLRGVFA